jgi:uncharacterized protein YeaO (DUF488 family)/alkylated DNA nucleotide flippase Atl1
MTSASDSIRRIHATVSRIPKGRVATYGQVAEVAGLPRRARLVGRALRELDEDSDVPWHRVVNAKGTISLRGDLLDHEGLQEQLLRREGVDFDGRTIPLERYRWQAAPRGAKSGGAPKRSLRSRPAASAIAVKRVYDPPSRTDGTRVLVDRLWPRGIAKAKARVDAWLKEVGPSTALRTWFGHDPARWTEFQRRYHRELANSGAARSVADLARRGPITLLFAAKDAEHNNAVALRGYLARVLE